MRARRAAAATVVLSTALVGVAIVLPASAQAAETAPPTGALIVNNASTTDPSAQPSACASAPYTTIQAAVNAAIAGATVYVCSGLYPEAVDIPTDLTLDGAQFGIDARTGRTNAADETIVDPIAAAGLNDFTYGTPNVLPPPASTPTTGTIDGFTISGADQPTADNTYGIVAFNDVGGGYHWVDNIITHVFYAGFIDTATSPAQSVIQHNLVEYTGEGFWEGRNYGPGADYSADNVLFDSNAFQYNGNQDIHYDGSYDLSNKATGLVASGNTSYNDAAFVLLIDTSGARVSDNTITWTGGASTAGITRFAPIGISSDNSDALISDNTVTGADLTADDPYYWDEFGITVSDGYGSGAPSVGVTITHNTLSHQVFGIALRNSNTTTATNGYVVSDNTITDSDIANGGGCTVDPAGYLDGGVGIFVQDQNYFPGSTHTSIVQNRDFSITGNTVTDPQCKGIWVQDIGAVAVNADETISGNTATGAGVFDCQDQTVGSGTAGTADSWPGNTGDLSSPSGLCPAATTVTDPSESGPTPPGQLAFTGASIPPLLFTSALLLLAGAVLLRTARGRLAAGQHR